MTLRRSHLSFAFLSFALAAGGCAGATSESGATGGAPAAPTITPALIAEGQTLFATAGRCGVCHGPTGGGGRSGPSLTDDTWLWVDTSGDVHAQLFRIIKEGIPEPRQAQIGMPAMGGGNLTDDQIHAIAAYVGSL